MTLKPPSEKPDATTLAALRTQIQRQHGLTASDTIQLLDGMTRAELTIRLIAICQDLPAAHSPNGNTAGHSQSSNLLLM